MYIRFYGVGVKIMTRETYRTFNSKEKEHLTSGRIYSNLVSSLKLLLIIIFGIFISRRLSPLVLSGLKLAIYNVIPAAFPFMIVSDLYMKYGTPEDIYLLRLAFQKMTNLPSECIKAYVCGVIGGFPLGAMISGKMLSDGVIDRDECEYLSAISGVPSIPFILAVVGESLLTDISFGFIVLFSTLLSSIISAYLWRRRIKKEAPSQIKRASDKYSFIASVRGSAESCLGISAFIALFACISGVISQIPLGEYVISFLNSILEVTNAVNYISRSSFSLNSKLILSAFALSFGGLSVMMQSSVVIKRGGVIGLKYLLMKLTSAAISSLLVLIILIIKG